ncbi:MAG: SpoIIE family protein phosphatase [Sulfitobacter sp.]|nr:SpoIIE family protein phosphatase [Sulfitobacter sp.]
MALPDPFNSRDPAAGPRRRALVVDDSRVQRLTLAKMLGRWGFAVEEAESGDLALARIRQDRPDIIISDWMMPGLSGPELCMALRELPGDAYSYFILLTSKTDKQAVAGGLDAGADDFLSKPVNGDELRARIAAGLRMLDMQRALHDANLAMADTLAELQRVYDSLDKDLQEARDLQQSLVRDRFCSFPVGDLSLLLRSSGHVGGDLVGHVPAGQGHLGLFAIDVSGHGVSSALMTARLAGYLTSNAPEQNIALMRDARGQVVPRAPSAALADLNRVILEEMETEHYFTALLAFLDMESGCLTLAQAGHPHPMIQRADGSLEQEGPGGLPVGLVEGAQFESFTRRLAPGDRLLIASDGITECPDRSGEMLGETGFAALVARLDGLRGTAFLEALIWDLARFAGTEDFPDDVSVLTFDYRGPC